MTSLRSMIIGATAASLLALPGAVTPASASAPPALASAAASRYDTSVRFLDFDHTRAAGSTTSVRGQVIAKIGADTGSVQGVRVRLLRKFKGSSHWKSLGTDYTSHTAHPRFVFNVASSGNATYKAVYGGNDRLKPSRNTTSVSVYRTFHAQLEDGSGRFHGRVRPHYAHRLVYLEKRACGDCGWKRTRTAKTGDKGGWSFTVGAPRHGRSFWRASTPASTRFITSHSAVFSTQRR